ncbi:MAG: ATP-binding protein [Candidatus Omnitrophica bacterium]|nr:ATP-binding protein [Candidatus Omnitrophota bacterium]
MKQLVVISGKGGTGKTVFTASLAALSAGLNPGDNKVVMADCDVDAADLHLLLSPDVKEKHDFKSGVTAFIDKDKCIQCGLCERLCRFDAISKDFTVDTVSCEGCSFCANACPEQAIEMKENLSGQWFISETRFGIMVHAKLGIAEENSGKLVTLVREQSKRIAEKNNSDWIIIDGSPGIGCPVIASLSGVDCAVIVTEPTLSGLHDAQRVVAVARHFNVSVIMVVNKYDLNVDVTEQIERYCQEENIAFAGKIEFNKIVVEAMVNRKTIVEYCNEDITASIKNIWDNICHYILSK